MMNYQTLVIDPPWPYQRSTTHAKLSGYADKQYDLLSAEEIQGLPIADTGADYVFLWTVGPLVRLAWDALEGWGFKAKSMLYWRKITRKGSPHYGVGYWFRGDVEPVLFGVRPGATAIRTNERACFEAPVGRHTAKPEVLQDLIERHFPGPYLELFARRIRPGWTCLGKEIDGLDILEALANV